MRIVILESSEQVANRGADIFVQQLNAKANSVLGLATGSTPVSLYKQLISLNKAKEISFKDARSFNLDEYLGLSSEHPQSYRYFMNENLFSHVDIDIQNTYFPDSNSDNPRKSCQEYEAQMEQHGGVDLQLLGIGRNGHIGFNEPTSSLASRTRVKALTKATIEDNARFFGEDEVQPSLSITMGIGTIMQAKEILLIATGKNKAEAIKATVEGPISAICPASILQMHPNVTVVIDQAAAQDLDNIGFYKEVEQENLKLLASYR